MIVLWWFKQYFYVDFNLNVLCVINLLIYIYITWFLFSLVFSHKDLVYFK